MGVSEIIVYVMAAFAALGAIDKIIGNRLGLGAKFEEGISAIAGIVLAMVGINSLAPVLSDLLEPVIVPVFRLLGADAAMFAGCVFANDGGAPALASALTSDAAAADYSGLIVASMMGVTVIFTIPVSLEMTEKADQDHVAAGVLAGLITLPIGCAVGGLTAGYSIGMIFFNSIPILILSLAIALGLWKFPKGTIKGFIIFGKIIMGVIILGLGAGIVEALTGFVVIPGMKPVSEGFAVAADIAMILAGAYPLMFVLTKLLRRPMAWMGKWIGINEIAVAGLAASLVNSIPMFGMVKKMDRRGKVLNIAFSVSAAFVFGDHLGFTAGYRPDMIVPVIVGKLAGGLAAAIAAILITREKKKDGAAEDMKEAEKEEGTERIDEPENGVKQEG